VADSCAGFGEHAAAAALAQATLDAKGPSAQRAIAGTACGHALACLLLVERRRAAGVAAAGNSMLAAAAGEKESVQLAEAVLAQLGDFTADIRQKPMSALKMLAAAQQQAQEAAHSAVAPPSAEDAWQRIKEQHRLTATMALTSDEGGSGNGSAAAGGEEIGGITITTPSAAADELMAMTGLQDVKLAVVNLYNRIQVPPSLSSHWRCSLRS